MAYPADLLLSSYDNKLWTGVTARTGISELNLPENDGFCENSGTIKNQIKSNEKKNHLTTSRQPDDGVALLSTSWPAGQTLTGK